MTTSSRVGRLESGNPAVAAALSLLVPGLGQAYNRQFGKALVFGALFAVAGAAVLVLVGVVVLPAVYAWAVVDAYRTADRMGRRELG